MLRLFMELETILTLNDIRKNIMNSGGKIMFEHPVSTGKCKECERGNWKKFSSQKIPENETCEYYSCLNSACEFELVSSISFNVRYD